MIMRVMMTVAMMNLNHTSNENGVVLCFLPLLLLAVVIVRLLDMMLNSAIYI